MTSAPATLPNLVGFAIAYARRGWAVFPVHTALGNGRCSCGAKCRKPGKHPRTQHGLTDATTDEKQIRAWWEWWPDAGVAIATGRRSGLLVVDIDPRNGGDKTWGALAGEHGMPPASPVVTTGSGGSHYYLSAPDFPVASKADGLGKGVDVKCNGGYVVAPPSMHDSGTRYSWNPECSPRDVEPSPAPAWILDKLGRQRASSAKGGSRGDPPDSKLASAFAHADMLGRRLDDGRWLCRCPWAAEHTSGRDFDGSTVILPATSEYPRARWHCSHAHCSGRATANALAALPKLAVEAAEREWAARPDAAAEPTAGGSAEPPEAHADDPLDDALRAEAYGAGVTADGSDLAAAERLVRDHGKDLRYVATIGGWHIWDGRRWFRSECGEIERLAQATGRRMLADAFQELSTATANGDDKGIKDAKEHVASARRYQNRRALESMMALAATQITIATSGRVVDADPWLLCCLNGTLDLRTGELREHRREDLNTKLCPVNYDAGARSEVWDRFMRDATGGDAELSGFLQRAVGYSLTGSTAEEVLFFVHGPAAAGKSTFVEALKHTLGDYAMTADFETFLARNDVGSPRNDIARLAGARLVASIEVEEGKKLAAGLVKMMTGGDTVAARFLHKEFFEFKPVCKLWLCANHAPRVRSDDGAMWRRILRLPFEQVVAEDKRDPKVKAELLDAHVSGAAILAWAVRGAMLWREAGLGVPKSVKAATEAYRQDQDPLAEFFKERCVFEPSAKVARAALRENYDSWAKAIGVKPVGARALASALKDRGVVDGGTVRRMGRPVAAWLGVGLSDVPTEPAASEDSMWD